jgi:hypothetical protein
MDMGNGKEDFPWVGAKCYVYGVNGLIVVKVPKHGAENMNSSAKRLKYSCVESLEIVSSDVFVSRREICEEVVRSDALEALASKDPPTVRPAA